MDWDILIRGGRVVDGSGRPAAPGEIGIREGKIGYVGPAWLGTAARTIDAAGMTVCPGFIDVHTHSDLALLAEPAAAAKVMQGVTTEVIGQDGLSYAPITDETLPQFRAAFKGINGDPPGLAWDWRGVAQFLDRFDRRVAVNVAMLVPHGNVRAAVLGMENRRPTPSELERMTRLLEQSMDEGAFGLSTGLTYAPCSYADSEELIALCRATARRGGFFAPHLRSYGADMEAAVQEAFEISAAAACPLHLTHFQASFSTGKGKAGYYLEQIRRARQQSARQHTLDVTLDAYPYLAGSTFLAGLLPGWVHEGGQERLRDRLSDPAARAKIRHEIEITGADGMHKVPVDWSAIYVSDVGRASRSDWIGLSLAEIAARSGRTAFDCCADLILDSDLAATGVIFIGHEENLQAFMRDPYFMGSSDGILVGARPHPRAWGAFARFFARYVRELGVLRLEECVQKLASLPAQRLGLADRGRLAPGYCADLVIFDPAAIQDTATYERPRAHPLGIPYVLVNGVVVKDDGRHTGALPGRALRHRKQ